MTSQQGVLIVGAGWMGRQVGLRMAICGIPVALVDKNSLVHQSAEVWMRERAAEYVEQLLASPTNQQHTLASTEDWSKRVTFGLPAMEMCSTIGVVLECVSEQVGVKRRILREFSELFPKPVIIASNSSYFTPSALAGFVNSPERFAHWHFHVPLSRSSIADVCGHPQTEPYVIERLVELSQQMDQYPLTLRREQPGYVFNWMLQALLRSALELAAKGVADVPEIDRAWKAVSGMPIGPFAMMDHIGLDVIEHALSNAKWDTSKPMAIDDLLAILRQPLAQGHLGLKTGRGFYEHD